MKDEIKIRKEELESKLRENSNQISKSSNTICEGQRELNQAKFERDIMLDIYKKVYELYSIKGKTHQLF